MSRPHSFPVEAVTQTVSQRQRIEADSLFEPRVDAAPDLLFWRHLRHHELVAPRDAHAGNTFRPRLLARVEEELEPLAEARAESVDDARVEEEARREGVG